MNPTRLVTALAVTAALTLAGCSDDPKPKLAPADTVSPTVEATTETVAPEIDQRDFISDYIANLSQALSTGDPSGFLEMSAPSCRNCQTFATNIEGAFADGGRILHGRWSVKKVDQVEVTDEGTLWFVDVNAAAERWVDAQGQTVNRVPAGPQLLSMTIAPDGSTPQVLDISFRTP